MRNGGVCAAAGCGVTALRAAARAGALPRIRRWRNNLLDSGRRPGHGGEGRIEAAVVELTNGALVTGPPKSASGIRWVSIPPFLLPDVIEHLEQFTGTADDQLVFTGPKGAQLRRSNFSRQWRRRWKRPE